MAANNAGLEPKFWNTTGSVTPTRAATGPLDELAAAAGYQVQDHGTLPLLRYLTAVK